MIPNNLADARIFFSVLTGTLRSACMYFSGSIPSSLAVLRNSSSSGCLGNTCPPIMAPIFSPLTTISTEKSISPAWQKYVPLHSLSHFTQRLLPSFDPLVYFIQKSVKLLPSVIYSPFLPTAIAARPVASEKLFCIS